MPRQPIVFVRPPCQPEPRPAAGTPPTYTPPGVSVIQIFRRPRQPTIFPVRGCPGRSASPRN
jgi:hypothetical protein